jgi:cytidine deaminase
MAKKQKPATTFERPIYQIAKSSRLHSYSPYSHAKVGAAIVSTTGEIFNGCNVENATYGATVCAERSAVSHAFALQKKLSIKAVYVVTDANPAWPPCGICLQVLSEFSTDSTIVFCCNTQGGYTQFLLKDLLPQAFGPKDLLTESQK